MVYKNPLMVIGGMVYYCYTNIAWIFPEKTLHPAIEDPAIGGWV